MHEDLKYMLALKEVEGIGGVLFRQLLAYFGSAQAVLNSNEGKLLKIPGIGKGAVGQLKKAVENVPAAEKLILDSQKKGIQIITFLDPAYPKRFKSLYDAPPILFFKGSTDLNLPRTVGIVGTRKATEYGKALTEKIVAELKPYGASIISGLAYGIDVAAHKAAIKYELPTVAVMAGGLDMVYPAAHRKYITDINLNGGILSENKNDVVPVAPQFIARNRIIAGLSDVIIIVESAKRGGGLVTAEYGNNYHREVFAVPGGINQPFSEGPNNLIRLNKAQIFTSVEYLVETMNWEAGTETAKAIELEELDYSTFTDEETRVMSLLKEKGDYHIDEISFETNIPLNRLASLLLNLEFMDLVKALPGKKFKLK